MHKLKKTATVEPNKRSVRSKRDPRTMVISEIRRNGKLLGRSMKPV